MSELVTLDGLQLHPPASDGTGCRVTSDKFTGWYDHPGPRTQFTARPRSAGVFYGPAYTDARELSVGGIVTGTDRRDLLAKQRQLAGLCSDPSALYALMVDEDIPLQALVQRSDDTAFKPINDRSAYYTLGLTAPDPIRYGTTTRRTAVDLGAPAPSGLNFGAGGVDLLANPTFDHGHESWTVSGGAFYYGMGAGRTLGGSSVGIDPDGTSAQCVLASEKESLGDGSKVKAGIWVNLGEDSTAFSCSVNWFDSTGTLISTSSNDVAVAARSWTYVENTFTVPSGAVTAQLAATFGGTPQNRWYADDASLEMAEAAGLDFVTGGGLDFGGGAGQALMYLDNPGTADVLPSFAFNRPVDQPVLTNPDNGGRLEYLGSVMAGQQLAIDCKRKTVLLNGISRRTLMGRADFKAFAVPHKGVLRVAFGTLATQIAGARVEASWLEGWW